MRSMTAFARASVSADWGSATWEIRSVNSRYLETHYRMPDIARESEMACRAAARKKVARGKLDCNLQLQFNEASQGVVVDDAALASWLTAAQQVAAAAGAAQSIDPMAVLARPGVVVEQQIDRDSLQSAIVGAYKQTLDALNEAREIEGDAIRGMIATRCDDIEAQVADVRANMPAIVAHHHDKIREKLAALAVDADSGRVEQELVLISTRADVDEEVDRIDAHLAEIRRRIATSEPVGRRLDFLMQELNREANTLGSKAVALSSTNASVELKVLIEQMREQVQNAE